MEKYDENGPLRGSFGEPSEHDISESLLLFKNKRVHVQSDISSHFKLLHILLFSINIIAFVVLLFSMRTRDGRSLVYSPLNGIIAPRKQYWNLTLGDRTPFTQPPSPEVDTLWNSISVPPGDIGLVVLNEQEKQQWNVTTVKLADGSGYAATIDVFHQLHCLDKLRRYIFNGTYQISPSDHPLWEDHIAHCIDSIRLSLQCSADVSIMPWKWIRGYALPWPDFRSNHECRNWDDLVGWEKDRKLDTEKPGIWKHPHLGSMDRLDERFTQNPLEAGKVIEYLDGSVY